MVVVQVLFNAKINKHLSYLKKIKLTQFRNFNFESFDFEHKAIAVTGQNGNGKTNLLDAIYYLCYTKSYFQSKEQNNVKNGTDGFRLEGIFDIKNENREEQICCIWKEGKKTIYCNNNVYEKNTDHIGKFTAIMIAPDDTELINGGSELRRKFIDSILALQNKDYLGNLLQYQKILQQRNAYLKNNLNKQIDHQLLDVYDEQLVKSGTYIIQSRIALSEILPPLISEYYTFLCKHNESADIKYQASSQPETLLQTLKQSRNKDIEYRRTLVGPHTEDWQFSIKDIPCKSHASQGQKKSFLISLKMVQLHLLNKCGHQPILLLDDIFEKLDASRLAQLFSLLTKFEFGQVFLSHTNKADFDNNSFSLFGDLQHILL